MTSFNLIDSLYLNTLESLDVDTASQMPNLIQMTSDAEVEYDKVVEGEA